MSVKKIFHSIGEALGILANATPLIGADAGKVSGVITAVHALADDVGATIDSVKTATSEGVKVDHNALRTGLESLLPALIEEGVALALAKLMPDHTAKVVAAATPEVVAATKPATPPAPPPVNQQQS